MLYTIHSKSCRVPVEGKAFWGWRAEAIEQGHRARKTTTWGCQWDTSPKCECGENNTAFWSLNSWFQHMINAHSHLNEMKPPNLTSLDSKLLESINISKENCMWCSNRSAHLSTLQIRALRQIEIRVQCEDAALSIDSQAGRTLPLAIPHVISFSDYTFTQEPFW